MLTYRIAEQDHCRRADSFLRMLLPDAPLGYLTKLITSGHCLANGTAISPGVLLHAGDTVTLKESDRTRKLLARRPPQIDILYEDGWILGVNKPADLPMHSAAEVDDRNLVGWGTEIIMGGKEHGKLRPVNRLDRGTSGVVLLAKSPSAAGMFGRMVKEEGLDKVYLAVVGGTPKQEGHITEELDGKEAETRYRLLLQGKGMAFLVLFPVTGRTHQLRRHLNLIGHPILGDRRYGGRPMPDHDGILLHSFRTAFIHPDSRERVLICAPLPANFLTLIKEMGAEEAALLDALTELTAVAAE
jgi:23S rRNA pseudouridine955/2504/2580 synthase